MHVRHLGLSLCLCSLFLAGAASTAFAVDGVTLIDQARALAGNVTPGDAPGFPVTLSQPGSYRLSGSLIVPAGTDGIVIAADFVTLDLNGFTVAGDGDGGHFGVVTFENNAFGGVRRSVVVRNGTVTKFEIGLFLSATGSSPIRPSTEVHQIRAIDNKGSGIFTGSNAILRDNIAVGNEVGITTSANSLISGNLATFNRAAGLVVLCPATIVDNLFTSNDLIFDIQVFNRDFCVIASTNPVLP